MFIYTLKYNMYCMRVSEAYSLGLTQPSLDFVDVELDSDAPLFIDPTALNLLDTEWGGRCRSLIKNFFSAVLEYVKNDQQGEAKRLLSALSEPNETHFGLSRGKPLGRGVGDDLADKMWQALSNSLAVQTGLITDLEDTALMIDGIASDIISDVVTNILREPLLEYTMAMARQFNIPVEEHQTKNVWDMQNKTWTQISMPQIICDGKRLMLTPKAIVRRSISYNAGQYYNKYLLSQLQDEDVRCGLVRVLKNGKIRPPTKRSIKERFMIGENGKINEKEQNRNLTPSRLEVLERYKSETDENPKPILDHIDLANQLDVPVPDWDKLLDDLLAIKPGAKDAKPYEQAIQALFNALFYPWLMYPIPQTRINGGRKIIDITYTNVAQNDFFKWVKDNYPAAYIFVECKNYSTDVGNPELDQLAGRFAPSRGKVGILVSRKILNRDLLRASCRDTAKDDRGYIIPLDDKDLRSLVDAVRKGSEGERLALLRERFNDLVL